MALPDQEFGPHETQERDGLAILDQGPHEIDLQGRQGERHGDGDKSRTWTGTRGLENPGMIIRQAPIRLNTTKAAMTEDDAASFITSRPLQASAHETVPRGLMSRPRAISRCDRTGRVANMRSMIMRT